MSYRPRVSTAMTDCIICNNMNFRTTKSAKPRRKIRSSSQQPAASPFYISLVRYHSHTKTYAGSFTNNTVMFKSLPTLLRTHTRRLVRRNYLGQAGEESSTLSLREQALLQVAQPRAEAIMASHTRLPNLPDKDEELEVRRKRLIYRSKQRGWLEVDLLLGTWAHQNVPQLSPERLNEYESFVNQETIDIYNIITLRLDVPDELKGTIVGQIQEWARANPLGKADPLTYKQVKESNQLT